MTYWRRVRVECFRVFSFFLVIVFCFCCTWRLVLIETCLSGSSMATAIRSLLLKRKARLVVVTDSGWRTEVVTLGFTAAHLCGCDSGAAVALTHCTVEVSSEEKVSTESIIDPIADIFSLTVIWYQGSVFLCHRNLTSMDSCKRYLQLVSLFLSFYVRWLVSAFFVANRFFWDI